MTVRGSVHRIDFVISNDGHHPAMFEPVIRSLAERSDIRIRVISMCEFRGLVTPTDSIPLERVSFHRIVPFRFRRASTGGQTDTIGSKQSRQAARGLSWSILLKRGIRSWLGTNPDLVVLPNDAAFPYERIAELLRKRGIPFVLVQEGIRFPLPLSEGDDYGRNGATAIAAWGESSEDFFRSQGVAPHRIQLTGSPRFDAVWTTDWESHAAPIREKLNLGSKVLLLLTNPIDDQGFCTTRDKMKLVRKFLDELESLFVDPEFSLVIKLHGRESEGGYGALMALVPHAEKIHILQHVGLYPLLALADASVIFASTVGLESLMLGCPIGVIAIPGHGFVHDFVSSGAAEGLRLDGDTAQKIKLLFEAQNNRADHIKAYVDRSLSCRGNATEKVVELLLHQLEPEKSIAEL